MDSSTSTNPSSVAMFWGKDSKGSGLHTYLPPSKDEKNLKISKLLNEGKGRSNNMGLGIVTKKAGPKLLEGYMNKPLSDYDHEIDENNENIYSSPLETEAEHIQQQTNNTTTIIDNDDNPIAGAQLERVLTNDPITAALTAPSNPSENYFNVLKALVAAVRITLVANNNSISNPQNYFKTPNNLNEAFPNKIREEDPDYFWMLEYQQKEDAYKNSSYVKGLSKAYAAIGDQLVYAFDRRPVPTPSQIAAANGITSSHKGHNKKPSGNGISAVRHHQQQNHTSTTTTSTGNSGLSLSSSSVYIPDLAPNQPLELLNMQMKEHNFRLQSTNDLLDRQGRTHIPNVTHTVGNIAISSGSGGTSGNPLPGDAVADTLRWSEQQRLEMEHRRARCEHVLHLLQREMAAESERQIILRKSAAKFATSEARFKGLEWESYAVGLDDPLPKIKGSGGNGWADRSGLSPAARKKGLRYKGNSDDRTLAISNTRGGSSRFTASDLAQARYNAAKERAESADLLMRILEDYRLVPLSVAAQYLQQTLEEVDEMYAELIGARAKEAGETLTPDEIKAHMAQIHADAEDELEYEELMNKTATKHKPGTVVVPSSYYVKKGGAEPMPKHDDIVEVKKFSAVHGGLSNYNVRPFTAREIARDTLIDATVLPGLDDGYIDPRSKLATNNHPLHSLLLKQHENSPYMNSAKPSSSISRNRNNTNSLPPTRGRTIQHQSSSSSSMDDNHTEDMERMMDGDTRHPLQPVVPGNHDTKDDQVGVGKLPPKPKKPAWLKNQKTNKTKTKPMTTSEEVLAAGPVPAMFKELDETLHKWQDNSRPSWQQQVLKSYDLSNLRESTANMYGIIQRTAKEPPDGRYSHLLGRYVSADVLRKQLADSRKLELAEKAKNRSPRA